ncbi:MAG TPA: transglutaminase N-terminal domain-containing protein, partial [Rhizomicrobium sp.]|nr:transglutaminase N-terminal domain-containing protein [Rhizomicrobium sp.]
MSIQAALRHVTRYRYSKPITLGAQTIRLRPAPHCRARIAAYSLTVDPAQHFINWQQDPQSNWLARVVVPEKTDHFTVTVDLTVEMDVINPFDFFLEPAAEQFPFSYAPELKAELEPYLVTSDAGAKFDAYLAKLPKQSNQTTAFLFDINAALTRDIAYLIRMEP